MKMVATLDDAYGTPSPRRKMLANPRFQSRHMSVFFLGFLSITVRRYSSLGSGYRAGSLSEKLDGESPGIGSQS